MLQGNEAFYRYKPFLLPIGFIAVGVILVGVAALLLQGTFSGDSGVEIVDATEETLTTASEGKEIIVEVAGAVVKPGVYRFPQGARVEDALTVSGGIAPKAKKDFIAQSINRAAKLVDGQKIYIPFEGEQSVLGSSSSSKLININNASSSELESLAGIGPATAQKIIQGRPYASLEELTSKKVISVKVFEEIKAEISLY